MRPVNLLFACTQMCPRTGTGNNENDSARRKLKNVHALNSYSWESCYNIKVDLWYLVLI